MSSTAFPCLLPYPHEVPVLARSGLLVAVLSAQAALGWALLAEGAARRAANPAPMPIAVDFVAPPAPVPLPHVPAPRPAQRAVPKTPPVVMAQALPAAAEDFVAPPPSSPAPSPVPAVEPMDAAPAIPAASPPALPAPRTLEIGSVRYLDAPALRYPPKSKRLGETGRVNLRVLVDAAGLPSQIAVIKSSGYGRLDEAALGAVRAARFKPYTENGQPQAFWVVIPLIFELEN